MAPTPNQFPEEDTGDRSEGPAVTQPDASLLREIVENAPIGILVKSLRPDEAGKYLVWNRKLEKISGLLAASVIGRTAEDVFPPETAKLLGEQDSRASQGVDEDGNAPVSVTVGGKTQIHRTSKTRINDATGKPIALIGLVEDVTKQEKTAEALRETENRWQLALAATDAGVWDWNIKTNEVFLSDRFREIAGISDAAPVHSADGIASLVIDEDLPAMRALVHEHLERKSDLFRGEFRIRRNDGTVVWLMTRGKAQFDETGKPTRAVGTVMDVSQVKSAEQQMELAKSTAESASRAKGDFLAMMSHEIRTPLNGVLGFADLLAETKLTDQQREYLQTIRDSGSTLLAILNDILDYSKIEAGKLDIELKPTDVRQIVQSLLAFFHPQAEKRGLELRLQIHSSVPSLLLCDPVRVRQIILNLMGNALKFTSKGFVEFDLCAQPSERVNFNEIIFYIRDTGIGISQADQQRLFEPFNQLDASTSRRFGGTGLGLSIVKRLVEIMGGGIQVESEIAKGTTFKVTLPCELVQVDYDPRRTMLIQLDITPDFAKRRPLKILVAEDNLVNRKLARLLLQKFGYVPDEAEDGSRAVAMSLENSYDLILMDIQMPGMDGYEAAERICELCPNPPRIVALTAHALKSDEERSKERGLDGHLSKPIRADHLRAILERTSRAVQSRKSP